MRLLLKVGHDVNDTDDKGRSSAHVAAAGNHVGTLEVLAETLRLPTKPGVERASVLDINAKDTEGGSPLHHAVAAGHLGAATFLVDAGANVNALDAFGRTPAWKAVAAGKVT